MTLDPNVTSVEHLCSLMAAEQEWIWQSVRFNVHTAFWVLSSHYQLDLALVSVDGPYEDFTKEDL